MKTSDSRYIVIKGIDWLFCRLDEIGYTPCFYDRHVLVKRIWNKDKSVSDELIKKIIGSVKYEK